MDFQKKLLLVHLNLRIKQLSAKRGICPRCDEHSIKKYKNGLATCQLCWFETILDERDMRNGY